MSKVELKKIFGRQKQLQSLSSTQLGYISTQQAASHGVSRAVLSHLTITGDLKRVCRGVYRNPSSVPTRLDYLIENYLRLAPNEPTFTHRSALEILELVEPIGPPVHLTVSREHRSRKPPADVQLHTTRIQWKRGERTRKLGFWVASPVPSFLGALNAGISDGELRYAIRRAVETGAVNGPSLARRGFDSSWNDATRIWDSLPAATLYECICDRLGRLADNRNVNLFLMNPTRHTLTWTRDWDLGIVTRARLEPEAQWRLHDFWLLAELSG
jgi:hypothetical protein